MRNHLKVNLRERSYPIFIGGGLLKEAGSLLRRVSKAPKVCIVTNAAVNRLYGGALSASLKRGGFGVVTTLLGDGERFKNLKNVEKIYAALYRAGFDRSDAVLALGGGVVGDMAGFAAATYMRGVDLIQFPTTLLAQVDSSVGGKTGVDFLKGKNMVGAFYQPKLVVCDPDVLKTLPRREYLCGLAEVVKYGAIKNERFFSWLEKSADSMLDGDEGALGKAVLESCRVKAGVVERDEKESGERAILNFGHTFGHGLETALNFRRLKHGEAVAVGMAMAARLSRILGLLDANSEKRVENLLSRLGLPVSPPAGVSAAEVLRGMEHDKKILSGRLRFVVIDKIGRAFVREGVSKEMVLSACGG
ncbi:MAG: 3-dehydroquinate synthase [Nitrospinae bacterium]|nr:3-dehydroquinate synthase [Nitrospinota bacterium]